MRNCNTCIYYDNRGFCTVHYTVPGGCKDYSPDRAEKDLIEVQEYRKLGTVEEVREAFEKTKAKKCIEDSCPDHTHYKCPTCGKIQKTQYKDCTFGCILNNCSNCGQRLEE